MHVPSNVATYCLTLGCRDISQGVTLATLEPQERNMGFSGPEKLETKLIR